MAATSASGQSRRRPHVIRQSMVSGLRRLRSVGRFGEPLPAQAPELSRRPSLNTIASHLLQRLTLTIEAPGCCRSERARLPWRRRRRRGGCWSGAGAGIRHTAGRNVGREQWSASRPVRPRRSCRPWRRRGGTASAPSSGISVFGSNCRWHCPGIREQSRPSSSTRPRRGVRRRRPGTGRLLGAHVMRTMLPAEKSSR